MTRPVAALILAALIIAASAPRPATLPQPVPVDEWRAGAPLGTSRTIPTADPPGWEPLEAVVERRSPASGVPSLLPAADARQPTATVVASVPGTDAGYSETVPRNAGNYPTLTGVASWFCRPPSSVCTKGYPASCQCAAAGPRVRAWLGPDWRGSEVYVSTEDRSIRVRLVDFCACPTGKVLDLFASSFAFLAPLSRGVIEVRLEPS